ncbi:hypothetical protein Tco_0705229 [Tanacetum coccineum]|uniref:Uncharacterized protein n=1 Tax=Tanacetum coccineum TaxID=301880 RepID=A0ABQ4Y401_9ASTR
MNANTFADDVLTNHIGGKEFKSIDGVGNEVLAKKESKRNDKGMPKEPNQEWKLNDKVLIDEDAWRKNRLISQAYANFCVAFIIWSSIMITLPGEFRFS